MIKIKCKKCGLSKDLHPWHSLKKKSVGCDKFEFFEDKKEEKNG